MASTDKMAAMLPDMRLWLAKSGGSADFGKFVSRFPGWNKKALQEHFHVATVQGRLLVAVAGALCSVPSDKRSAEAHGGAGVVPERSASSANESFTLDPGHFVYVHLDETVQLAKIVQVHEMTVDIFAIEDAVVIKEVPKGMLRQCPKRAGEDTLGGNTLGDEHAKKKRGTSVV